MRHQILGRSAFTPINGRTTDFAMKFWINAYIVRLFTLEFRKS